MRHLAVLSIVFLAACSAGLLETSTTPPTGLPVSITSSFSPGIVPTTGTLVGKGDSVVAIVQRPATCGRELTANAGTSDAGLVITILLTSQGVQSCAPLNGMTIYRAVVHGVPSGARAASAHVRLVSNGANSDTTVVQSTISLP